MKSLSTECVSSVTTIVHSAQIEINKYKYTIECMYVFEFRLWNDLIQFCHFTIEINEFLDTEYASFHQIKCFSQIKRQMSAFSPLFLCMNKMNDSNPLIKMSFISENLYLSYISSKFIMIFLL